MHREAGPLGTFEKAVEAGFAMAFVLMEEPDWAGDLWIEPFEGRGPRAG